MEELTSLQILDLAGNQIESINNELFLGMDKLQILDLQENNLRTLPTSIGYLLSLTTLLLAGNPFNSSLETIIAPILESQAQDDARNGNSPAAQIKNRRLNNAKKINWSQSTSLPYLYRLQGYLSDIYDLEFAAPIDPQNYDLDIDVDYLVSYCRIPMTTSLENSEYRAKVIEELIFTEETYVSQLALVRDLYVQPMEQEKLLDNDCMSLIFSNIQNILELHSR